MAIPTSAFARAGASLMPSPTIATTCPSAWSARDRIGLARRAARRRSPGRCRPARAIASAVGPLSPGQHRRPSSPSACSRATASRASGFGRSATAITPAEPAVHGHEASASCPPPPARRPPRPARPLNAAAVQQLPVPDQHPPAVHLAVQPVPGDGREPRGRRQRRAPPPPAARRGPPPADARSRARPTPPAAAARRQSARPPGDDVGDAPASPRSPSRSCPGRRPSTRCGRLQGLAAPDQDAGLGAPAGADHDRRRRGQPQRARAGDDEHRHRRAQRLRQPRLRRPASVPDDERHDRQARTTGTKCR